MQPVTLSDEEQKLYLKFKLKQIEDEYYHHKNTLVTLSEAPSDSITESLIDGEKNYMESLDEAHVEIKSKLANV